jgi:outer membrane receptor protein involved in Fe transport
MPVYSACVDKMDPVSAYVETENLDRLEIDKDGSNLNLGQQIGGAVNLIPETPSRAIVDSIFGFV